MSDPNELAQLIEALERQAAELSQIAASLRRDNASPDLIPLKAAAAHSRFSYESVRLWARRGIINAQQVGGRWLVSKASLDAHMKRRRSS